MNDSELLEKRVRETRERIGKSQKERYRLAKKLGFSPWEATILQNWKTERIEALARERGLGF
jgi:hypothetical protein